MKRFMYVLLFVLLTGATYAQQAKYVFYFIGDGMGVNQVNGTEMYLAEQEGRIGVTPLLFTQFPAVGVATTFSATNSVTDSSAAGTALATGVKTYNGAIGMDDQKNVIQSVAEKAKKAGKKVGVTTSVSVDVSIWLIPCEVSVVIRQKNDDFFAVPAKSSGFPVDSCGFLMISRYFSLHF